MGKKEDVDDYLATIARMEPDIHMIDASAFYASVAISLKRIADEFEKLNAFLVIGVEKAADLSDALVALRKAQEKEGL